MTAHLSGGVEPEQVYNAFFEPVAVSDWRQEFSAFSPPVSYSGVFTHQKPYVDFEHPSGNPQRCELADLLIVFSDHSAPARYAWLLQAKVHWTWIPPNKAQWDLLTNWPDITYRGDPSITPAGGSKWPVTRTPFSPGGSPKPEGQYLMLDKNGKQAETSECSSTAAFIHLASSLKTTVDGAYGKFSYHSHAAASDWDRLIWDLINSIGITSATVGGTEKDRGLTLMTDAGSGEGEASELAFGADGWGVPIIHLQAGEPKPSEQIYNDIEYL